LSKNFVFVTHKEEPVVVLFVHGLRGSLESTWKAFAKLLRDDADFGADVALWGYTTGVIGKVPTIWQAADQLQTELRLRLKSYRRIILVGHSLGGLIIRAMVVRALQEGRVDDLDRIDHILTLGTPNDGVELARLFKRFSKQISDLQVTGDSVVELRNEWINRVYTPQIRRGEERNKLAIPLTTVVGLDDDIVTPASARSFFQDPPPETVPGDHVSMKDPKDSDATIYLLVRRAVDNAVAAVPASAAKIEAVHQLEGPKGFFGLEVVLNNSTSRVEFRSTEIALGGRVAGPQYGASPFFDRVLFSVQMKGALTAGPDGQDMEGVVHTDDDDFGYRVAGTYQHINGTPERSFEYAVRFPAYVRCESGGKLQIRLVFQPATKEVLERESRGEFRASYVPGITERTFWVEIRGDDGAVRYEDGREEFDGLLAFIANKGSIVEA
jgi:surfactin synthase thioesterase subunit